jgi:hypothetical protein
MRLLRCGSYGELNLTKDFVDDTPSYAILSHTWGADEDEVTFYDLENGPGTSKAEYAKLQFCGKQAEKDGLKYFWVDTCCINKANHAELSEAIASMFRWYCDAQHCYVYLSDVSVGNNSSNQLQQTWDINILSLEIKGEALALHDYYRKHMKQSLWVTRLLPLYEVSACVEHAPSLALLDFIIHFQAPAALSKGATHFLHSIYQQTHRPEHWDVSIPPVPRTILILDAANPSCSRSKLFT